MFLNCFFFCLIRFALSFQRIIVRLLSLFLFIINTLNQQFMSFVCLLKPHLLCIPYVLTLNRAASLFKNLSSYYFSSYTFPAIVTRYTPMIFPLSRLLFISHHIIPNISIAQFFIPNFYIPFSNNHFA